MPRSYRLQFKFWLDIAKLDEKALAEDCENLKARRGFQTAIRDGLRLLLSLRRGETEVLLELFPWVANAFSRDNQDDRNGSGQLAYHTIDAAARAIMERAEGLIMASAGDVPKALNAPKPLDEPLPEIEVKAASADPDNRSDWNFTISSALMVYGSADNLPAQIIAYGLRTGRIQPSQVSRKPQPNTCAGGPKPLAGTAIQLAAPRFDDLPMDF